jgi:hypothetical protein
VCGLTAAGVPIMRWAQGRIDFSEPLNQRAARFVEHRSSPPSSASTIGAGFLNQAVPIARWARGERCPVGGCIFLRDNPAEGKTMADEDETRHLSIREMLIGAALAASPLLLVLAFIAEIIAG